MAFRRLREGQKCVVLVGGPGLSRPYPVFETADLLIEAPNWSADGHTLIVNGRGTLWALDLGVSDPAVSDPGVSGPGAFDPPASDVHAARLRPVPLGPLPDLNNDHVLDPDGRHAYVSAEDGRIYRVGLDAGREEHTVASPEDGRLHYLHGISPDGTRLAYVEMRRDAAGGAIGPGRLALVTSGGTGARILPTGPGHVDGPEWSPDGRWLYFNTDHPGITPAHARIARAQIARISPDGASYERVLAAPSSDWFPHLSPDGRWAAYLSFPPGTAGHPPDRQVAITVVDVRDWSTPVQRYRVPGGQGTLNVNSWSPGGRRFAFVAYPVSG